MQNHNRISISKLTIPGAQSNELSYVFFQNVAEQESSSPLLFGIFQMNSIDELYHTIIGHTVKNLVDYYQRTYESSKGAFSGESVNSAEFIFENALQYVSDSLNEVLRSDNESKNVSAFNRRKVHMILGVLHDKEVYLTVCGTEIKSYLFYPIIRDNNFSHYSIMNVLGSDNEDTYDDSGRLFSSVISGTLSAPKSTLVFCNGSFLNYISLEQLKQVISNFTTDQLSNYFQRLLGKANSSLDFSALFLGTHEHASMPTTGSNVQTMSDNSMNGLVVKQKVTEKILAPAMRGQASSIVTKTLNILVVQPFIFIKARIAKIEFKKIVNESQPQRDAAKRVIKIKTARGLHFIKQQGKTFLPKFKEQLSSKAKVLVQSAFDAGSRMRGMALSDYKEKFLSMSPASKGLLVLAAIFIVLFGVSIISLQQKRAGDRVAKQYADSVNSVEQKANEAEASVIYENDDKALTLLAEAENLLKRVPQANAAQQLKYKELEAKVAATKNKILHIFEIDQPAVIAQLENQIPTLASLKIMQAGTKTVLYNNESIYTLDTSAGKVLQINTQAKIPSIACAVPYDEQHYYFCTGDGTKLFVLNLKDDTVQQVMVKLPSDKTTIKALATFGKRVYFIDGSANTIYRSNVTKQDSFAKPTQWLREKNPALDQANNIFVDGTVYVVSGNTLLKGIGGKLTTQTLPSLTPALGTSLTMWTDELSSSLYIADPTNGRIIVIDKISFKVKAQLLNDSLKEIKSFVVQEKKKELWAIVGNQVVRVPLSFMK